jgi:hypothetical protein
MVSARALREGMQVVVTQGPFKGLTGTVVDPEVFPDGHPDQRKMRIDINGVGETLIIPKQLDIAGALSSSYEPTRAVPVTSPTVVVSRSPIESLDDPILDRFRPTRNNILKMYVSRILPGGIKDTDALLNYWRDRVDGYPTNVGLVGDTQSGKTMLVEVMSHLLMDELELVKPIPVFTLSGTSAITDHDMMGQYRPDETGNLVWMEGIVALAARLGGILYLDEINAMPGNVTAGLHPLLDDRHQVVNVRKPVDDGHGGKMPEVIYANKNMWVIATYNPGYAGMSKPNEALMARIAWMPWDYDEEVEKRLIKSPAIRLFGQALRSARETRAIVTPVGTSALQRLERDVKLMGVEFALWAFCGRFTNKSERTVVNALLDDRSIRIMLNSEIDEPAIKEEK